MNYAAILCARNERNFIDDCIKSIINQKKKPFLFVIIDDDSNDGTYEIAHSYSLIFKWIHPIKLKNRRYKIRGVNTALAINHGLKHIFLTSPQIDYILTIDADCSIPHNYVETIIDYMEKHEYIGLCSGLPYGDEYPSGHIKNGARMYKAEFLRTIGEVPPIHGFDTYLFLRVKYDGFNIHLMNIKYLEKRLAKIKTLYQFFLAGRSRYIYGFTLLDSLKNIVYYLKLKPYFLGSLILFLSYILHHLTRWRLFEDEYYWFMKRYLDYGIINLRSRVKIKAHFLL